MTRATAPLLVLATLLVSSVARAGPAPDPKESRPRGRTLVVAMGGPCAPGAAGDGCDEQRWFEGSLVDLFGLRASTTKTSDRAPSWGITVVSEGTVYGAGRYASVRMGHTAMLGVGPDGVEGGIGADYAFGARLPLGLHHGPLARLGMRGHLLGDSELYSSLLELPELQVGYQLLDKHVHLEVAGRGGAVLVGRYNAGDGRRKLGNSLEYGGYATLRWEDAQLELDLTRVALRPGAPVDSVTGLLCSVARPLGMCLDARFYRGDVALGAGGSRLVRAAYVGIAVGGALRE